MIAFLSYLIILAFILPFVLLFIMFKIVNSRYEEFKRKQMYKEFLIKYPHLRGEKYSYGNFYWELIYLRDKEKERLGDEYEGDENFEDYENW